MDLQTSIKLYCTATDLTDGEWRTINGHHVFIRSGESPKQALMRTIGKSGGLVPNRANVLQEAIAKEEQLQQKLRPGTPAMGRSFTRLDRLHEQLHRLKSDDAVGTPKTLYHITPQSRLQSIQKVGLVGRKEGTIDMAESKKQVKPVYSFTDIGDASRLREHLLDQGDIPQSEANNLVVVHYQPKSNAKLSADDEFSELLDEDESGGNPWGGKVIVHSGNVAPGQIVGYQVINPDGSLGALKHMSWGRNARKR